MTTTKAQALAVALDHAEETGEYPPELVDRVVAMFEGLRIVQLGPIARDNSARGRGSDGTQLVSIRRYGVGMTVPSPMVPAHMRQPHSRVGPFPSWELTAPAYEATVHTAVTGTSRCERADRWYETYAEAVAWLRERLRPRGWTLLVLR